MKQEIIIKNSKNEIIFQGNILDIPIKEDYIIQKSIEIFDDDDPCIIHKSFVIKKVVDDLLDKLPKEENIKLKAVSDIDFLDCDIADCSLTLK